MVEENVSFEDNLKELEEIVAKLEKGDVPLDMQLKNLKKQWIWLKLVMISLKMHRIQLLK